MTDDQHRQIGAVLGFPECCVEAWIENLRSGAAPLANVTGHYDERERPLLEALAVHVAGSSILGRLWGADRDGTLCSSRWVGGDLTKRYVPCIPCAQRLGTGIFAQAAGDLVSEL
jgi:hypothetical protein